MAIKPVNGFAEAIISSDQQPKPSLHLTAFIDVMGFREMVKKKNDKKISTYFALSSLLMKNTRNLDFTKHLKFTAFSDCIAITRSISADSNKLLAVREFLAALTGMQAIFALGGVWVRGGVSIGDLVFDETRNMIFGDALIDAIDLEQKHANYPRIVIDQRLVALVSASSPNEFISMINEHRDETSLKNYPHQILFEWKKYGCSHNSFTKDYPLFLDYLGPYIAGDKAYSVSNLASQLQNDSQESPVAYKKFRWVADYALASIHRANQPGPTTLELRYMDEINALEMI